MSISYYLLLGLSLLAGGCDVGDQGAVRVVVIGDAASPFEAGAHLPLAAQLLRAATTQGLVTLDAEGHVAPALADRWIVTDGGMSYIFRLRDGRWPDGSALTGESARAGLRTALDGLGDTPLARDLAGIADVRAMAGRVVEIRLARPMPDFLQLLAQPELGLAHRGKGWGPMELKCAHNMAYLSPIAPEKRGLAGDDPAAGQWGKLRLVAMPGGPALAAFARGDADVVLGGGFADLPRTTPGVLSKSTARQDPVAGLFGLVVARAQGLLATPAGREALAMAIDRDSYAAGLGVSGWLPTTRIVPPGLEGGAGLLNAGVADAGPLREGWADIGIEGRRIIAARRVAQWASQKIGASRQMPSLRITLPAGPGADILFERLSSDFAAIGVSIRHARPGEATDLRLLDSVARYPRAAWYLNQLSCAALRGPCSADADAEVARARAAPDPATAITLWAKAEQTLTASNVFIPLGPPVRWSLARGNMPGLVANRWGVHPLPALARKLRGANTT